MLSKLALLLVMSAIGVGGTALMLNSFVSSVPDPIQKQAVSGAGQSINSANDALNEATKQPSVDSVASSNPTAKKADAAATSAASTATNTTPKVIRTLEWIWGVVKVMAAIMVMLFKAFLVASVIALITRTIDRRRRTYALYEMRNHREGMISTEQLRSFMSSTLSLMHVRRRRFQRFFLGAPSLTFRILSTPVAKRADSQVAAYIQVPDNSATDHVIRRAFADAYQDAELVRVEKAPNWGKEIVRLKKTRAIPFTLQLLSASSASESFDEGFSAPTMDRLVTTLTSRKIPAEVQYVLTSVPRPFDRFIYYLSRFHNRFVGSSEGVSAIEGRNTAEGSALEAHAFTEVRIGTPSYSFSRDIGAVLAGAAGGDSQLRERRPVLRKRLYQARFLEGIGNPIPSWLFMVLSVSELVSIWQLPSSQLRSVTIKRTNRRRLAVPPEVSYPDDPARGMYLTPENRVVELLLEDMKYGLAATGQQGMGKSVLLATLFSRALEQDPHMAGLLCDPNSDVAELALRLIPAHRKVHYIDFNNAEIGIDPFLLCDPDDEHGTVNVILYGLIDVVRTEQGETQMMSSSKDLVVNAIYATLATTRYFGKRPTFWHLKRWLSTDPKNIEWQKLMLSTVISRRPDRHAVVDAYSEFHSNLERSESQFTVRAAAPQNKMAEILNDPLVSAVLHHPNALNIEQAILNGDVIIVNGKNNPSADHVFRFLWQMVDQALGRIEMEIRDPLARPKLLFCVDESPSIMTPTTAGIIAKRRSAGLHMMLGWQHDTQVADTRTLSTLQSLLQNVFQFRCGPEDARTRVELMQAVYDDQQDSRLREGRMNRVSVADLINCERYHFYTAHLSHGNRCLTYSGKTINPARLEDNTKVHLGRQIAEGGRTIGILAAPNLDQESKEVRARMMFNPPKFRDVTAMEGYDRSPMEALGIDFDGALAINDREAKEKPPESDDGPSEFDVSHLLLEPSNEDREKTPGGSGGSAATATPERPGAGKEDTSVLDEEVPFTHADAMEDALEVAQSADGFHADAPAKKFARDYKLTKIGALGQIIPGEMTKLLENVDSFRNVDTSKSPDWIDPKEPHSTNVAAMNATANKLANDNALFPPEWQIVIKWLYEFNYLTTDQIGCLVGRTNSPVSRRLNTWLDEAWAVRGLKMGRWRVWTLTEMGAKIGRQLTTRNGPLVPFEPGKSDNRRHEADRVWTPRNYAVPEMIVHDLHLASYVMQMVLLCDGDFRMTNAPQNGIIQRVRGEFGSVMDPPLKAGRGRGAKKEPVDLFSISQVVRGLGFAGIDGEDATLHSLYPDAIVNFHNLAPQNPDPKKGRKELWIEMDRSGHLPKLRDKMSAYDAFLGAWWQTVPRYQKAGGPPGVLFVAKNMEILKRDLAVADETLRIQSGPTRISSNDWDPPRARRQMFFALETDLHKGSMRVYRVPEQTQEQRGIFAADQRDQTEAKICQPEVHENFLPKRLLAGRREGTHEPGPH